MPVEKDYVKLKNIGSSKSFTSVIIAFGMYVAVLEVFELREVRSFLLIVEKENILGK